MKTATLLTALFIINHCVAIKGLCATHGQALVIGNDSYPGNALKNARNDAKGVAKALGMLGYNVTLQLDVDRQALQDTINDFVNSLSPADVVVFYYSGHGLQMDGENYLVPIDFKAGSAANAKEEAYSLSSLLKAIRSSGSRTQIIILDACRDNPFLATRSLHSGWANLTPSSGAFLAFGTGPGFTADDNPKQSNGLFTGALLKYISSPELNIEELFEKVREDVIRDSHGLQVPWISTNLIGPMHLAGSQFGYDVAEESTSSSDESSKVLDPRSIASVGNGSSMSSSKSVSILIDQGLLLAEQQNYDEAVRSLSAALVTDPRSSLALRLLGLIFHLVGKSADAIAAFDRSLAENPSDAEAFYGRCLAGATTDPVSAVRDCEAALGLDPDFSEAHIGLANALFLSGQLAPAYMEAITAVTLNPKLPVAYALRGKIASALGKSSEAKSDYDTAVRLTATAQ